jgi:diguanylate cyclase (GGDEF)-like protein
VGLVDDVLGLSEHTVAGLEERARHVRATATLGAVFGVLFAAFNMLTPGMLALGWVELGVVAVLLLPAGMLSRSLRTVVAAERLLLLAATALAAALIAFGGIEATGLYWVNLLPFIAFFIAGQRQGWGYCVGMMATMALYFTVGQHHLPWGFRYTPVVATQFLLSFTFFTLVAAAFNRARTQFEDRLQRRVEEKTADAVALLNQLEFLATHDSHTGLPNQVQLLRDLDRFIDQATVQEGGLAVCIVRVERLFEFTNVLGAAGGDELVRAIAGELEATCGVRGTLARTRRDEFAIVYPLPVPGLPEQDLAAFIRDHPVVVSVQGYSMFLELSIGVATFPEHAREAPRLLHRAEQAMLQSVRSHRTWSLYSEAQEETFVRHHLLFGRLRDALQHGQLQLYYQPQVELATGRLHAAEALLRWWDPEAAAMVPPATFIPVAEESGLMQPITRWVVTRSLRDCAAWRATGLEIGVSINLSARNLLEPDLLPFLEGSVRHHGLAPGDVCLEITEGCFMDFPERAMAVVRGLHAGGFRLSIDDFGTGYSSLSYLRNLPVAELKIDRTFVLNLLEAQGDQAIVSSTIELAHNLRRTVVAEGIEDPQTADWLRERGCDLGQGYWLARPMPVDEFTAFARRYAAGSGPA